MRRVIKCHSNKSRHLNIFTAFYWNQNNFYNFHNNIQSEQNKIALESDIRSSEVADLVKHYPHDDSIKTPKLKTYSPPFSKRMFYDGALCFGITGLTWHDVYISRTSFSILHKYHNSNIFKKSYKIGNRPLFLNHFHSYYYVIFDMSLSITSSTLSSQQEAPKSCVKRDRARRQESKNLRENILNNLPILTNREVRRFRIPYHEALCLELDEDGFCEAAKFFRLLIQYQEDMRNEAGPESFIWFYPQLVNEKDKLDILKKGLQEAEEGKLVGKFKVECEKFLKIAIYFSNLPVGWWWLARQLFLQATDCAENYKDDGGRLEAIVRYIFGRFYLYQCKYVFQPAFQLQLYYFSGWDRRSDWAIENLSRKSCRQVQMVCSSWTGLSTKICLRRMLHFALSCTFGGCQTNHGWWPCQSC